MAAHYQCAGNYHAKVLYCQTGIRTQLYWCSERGVWYFQVLTDTLDGHDRGAGEAARQAQVLQAEGVDVGTSSMGEYMVSLAEYGWFPEDLP